MANEYSFDGKITEEVLNRYLSRAVTVSLEAGYELHPTRCAHVRSFILNTGAKYICRAATCWSPSAADVATHEAQKAFIDDLHREDPDVVFEACVFECIGKDGVNSIPVPAYVFEAFGLPVQERNFSYEAMLFPEGKYRGQWGDEMSVPDMTSVETQMFFYYRACDYINSGFEALHLGQVHWIGERDRGWVSWTKVLGMIRDYAKKHARRHFVFMNAHTHGILDANGKLMFDFHMYPSRPCSDTDEAPHRPDEYPQHARFRRGFLDSIYGDSKGGETVSGWTCDALPYLVELDNFGVDCAHLNTPTTSIFCWGMDEITWYANQPAAFREEFLSYADEWVGNADPGLSHFAMPGQRVANLYDAQGNVLRNVYMAYDKSNCPDGNDDEHIIRKIWQSAC